MKRYRPWPCLFAAPLLVSPGLVAQPAETPPAAFPSSETQPADPHPRPVRRKRGDTPSKSSQGGGGGAWVRRWEEAR